MRTIRQRIDNPTPAGEKCDPAGRCAGCAHFEADPAMVESALPGMTVLASAYSSVSAGVGLCMLHDLVVSPWKGCGDFEERGGGSPA